MSESSDKEKQAKPPGHIYVYVYGGLGNQLFQAAFASVVRAKSGCSLSFIVENFKNDGLRSYLLASFPRLRASVVPMEDAFGASVINESDVRSFPPQGLLDQLGEITQGGGRLYLSGFWQKDDFYTEHRALLRDVFTPVISDALNDEVKALRQTECIGLHMRRQGYGHMGLTKSLYYLQAITEIRQQRGDIPVHVFSDDPVYSMYLLRNFPNVHLTSNGDLDNPLRDFVLLSACTHHIIANSTFSWWAAWLAETPDSIIYAPQPWIIPDPLTNPVPERWRRMFDAIQEQ